MNRGDSPLQAKAKRRQSDAKWRASVATCYDTLKYVVPNVKNMTKRKVSKALILQESEKHIKELEAAIIHLLGAESKKKGKAVLWEEDSVWSPCTLDKLRQDFAQKQQSIFHMAVNGRRCYNLLQDIKEEVFAMEAEPPRLAVLDENSQAMSSLLSKLHTRSAKEGVQPTQRINLVLSGCGTSSKQPCYAGALQKTISHCETTIGSQAVLNGPRQVCHASELNLPNAQTVSRFGYKPCPSVPNPSSCSSPATKTLLFKSDKDVCTKVVGIHASNSTSGGSSKAFSTYSLSSSQCNPSDSRSHCQQESVKGSSHDNPQLNSTSSSVGNNSHRLKIHIEYVNGNFYLVSGNKNSTIHLIKTSSAPAGYKSIHLQKASALTEERQEQEVPSMKLPLKRPAEDEPEENNKQQTALTGIKQLPTEAKGIKQEICSPDASYEKDFYSDQRSKLGVFTVSVSSAPTEKFTPSQSEKSSSHSFEIKEEIMDTYTPRNDQDPLLSSLAIPKPDDSTPLFMRIENDMVIKRPPKLGSARKRLNFGQSYHTTPDKHARLCAGGFTPVKLPNEFGMVPDEDGNSMGSLVSPWKIVDSPSYAHSISSQNCMASSSMLDLDDNLMCLETLDTMDLGEELDSSADISTLATEETLHNEKTNKRRLSPVTPEAGIRQQPKCRRKLEKFYGGMTISTLANHEGEADSSDNQSVPDIYKIADGETLENQTIDDHFDYIKREGENFKQTTPKCEGKLTDNTEENHVVPDSCEQNNRNTCNGDDLAELDCLESPSSGNSIFYSSSDCDDFDGYYYYYRLMSHQLKQGGKSLANTAVKVEAPSSEYTTATPPSEHKTAMSSPNVAAKIAHMWSCLPLHDKLTMATLASLEQRQRSPNSPDLGNHLGITQQHQKFGVVENELKVTQSGTIMPQYGDFSVSQAKPKFSPSLGLPDIDDGWVNFSKTPEAMEKEKSEDIPGKSNDFHNSLQLFCDSDHHAEFKQESVSECGDLENFEGINIDSCLQNLQDDLQVPKIELIEGMNLETNDVFKGQDVLMLGELSPDLQAVEVQPLFDHTYDQTFHLD